MLKKISHILFAVLILLGSTGISLSKHYCGTLLKTVSVSFASDDCCDTPMNCCHNETIKVKIEDDYAINSNTYEFGQQVLNLMDLDSELFQNDSFTFESIDLKTWVSPPPPKIQTVLSKIQVYLL